MGAVQVHKMCTKSAKAKIKVTLSPCIVHKSRMDQKLQSKIRGDQEYKEWTKKFHKTNLKFSPPSKHLPSHSFKWTTSSKESPPKLHRFFPTIFFFLQQTIVYQFKKSNLATFHKGIKSPTWETICLASHIANASITCKNFLPNWQNEQKSNADRIQTSFEGKVLCSQMNLSISPYSTPETLPPEPHYHKIYRPGS